MIGPAAPTMPLLPSDMPLRPLTMRTGDRGNGATLEAGFSAMLITMAFATLALFVIRLTNAAYLGDLRQTTPGETFSIVAIWNLLEGRSLYTDPRDAPFAIVHHNFLFYYVYAAIVSLLSDHPDIARAGRFVTAGFAALGAFMSFYMLRGLLHSGRGRGAGWSVFMVQNKDNGALLWMACFVCVLWFGTAPAGWWALSNQPHMATAVFALAGIIAGLASIRRMRHHRARSAGLFVLSVMAFYMAWAFQQTAIVIAAAYGVWLLAEYRPVRFAATAGGLGGLIGLTFWIGGPDYSHNMIFAPALQGISLPQAGQQLGLYLSMTGFVPLVGGALAILVCLARYFTLWTPWRDGLRRRLERVGIEASPSLAVLSLIGLAAFSLGTILMGREGGGLQHLLAGHILLGLVAVYGGLRIITVTAPGRPRRMIAVLLLLLLPSLAMPMAQIAVPNRIGETWRLLDPRALETRLQELSALAALPKPVFTNDLNMALPWYTSRDGRAVVLDRSYYDRARMTAYLNETLEDMIRRGAFGALLLVPGDPLIPAASRAGYGRSPRLSAQFDGKDVYLRPPQLAFLAAQTQTVWR